MTPSKSFPQRTVMIVHHTPATWLPVTLDCGHVERINWTVRVGLTVRCTQCARDTGPSAIEKGSGGPLVIKLWVYTDAPRIYRCVYGPFDNECDVWGFFGLEKPAPTDSDIMAANAAGMDAFDDGKGPFSPYNAPGTVLHNAWYEGWLNGQRRLAVKMGGC